MYELGPLEIAFVLIYLTGSACAVVGGADQEIVRLAELSASADLSTASRPCRSVLLGDPEHRVIFGVGQLREVRPYVAPGDLAVLGDDVPSFVDWDLARVEDLGLPLAAQLALAGGSEIADPVGLAIWGNQIAAVADLDDEDPGGNAANPVEQMPRRIWFWDSDTM